MRVLVACEESQEVCKAFRALGHEAYSCDIQPCSGGHPEWHIQGIEAKQFFMAFFNADCPRVAIENPVPSSVFDMPKYTQVIQPYEFGHQYSKKTCLWLKNLPPLKPTEIVENYIPFVSSGSYTKTHDPKYKGASRKGGAAKSRSKTFPGIAKAMAEQWGGICI